MFRNFKKQEKNDQIKMNVVHLDLLLPGDKQTQLYLNEIMKKTMNK